MPKDFPPPNYWTNFSFILKLFNFLGVMPVTILKIQDKTTKRLEVRFSRSGYVIAMIFLLLSLIHTIWAPTMLIKLEKSIEASVLDLKKSTKNMTAVLRKRNINTKLGIVVKILHPLLVSVSSVSARVLSVTVLAKSMALVFKAFAQVDKVLSLPPTFYRSNFGTMTAVTIISLILHVPIVVFHLWEIYDYRDFWDNVWEAFSMMNVFTSFVFELEFVLFCLSMHSRFKYINRLLTAFVSEEFIYDFITEGRLKKIFSRWKTYVRPRNKKIFSSDIKTRGQLFQLFSKMDAANGGRLFITQGKINLSKVKKSLEPETLNLFKSLRIAHVLLFDVMQLVNDLYQIHLLVSIFSSVTKILFNFYFTIFGFLTSLENVPHNILAGELYLITFWSIYFGLRFMLIVSAAHFTVSASKEAGKIISKIDPRGFDLPSRIEIKMLSDHLFRRDFEFSACGLFNLNTSLISTSFSSGVTYLVIMAQFH